MQVHYLRRPILGIRRYLLSLIRLLRIVLAPPGCHIVALTKNHPIYTSFAEVARVPGYRYYWQTGYSSLRILDRLARARVGLIHRDAANPTWDLTLLPQVVECEGRPAPTLFSDSCVKRIFCQSRWAGGEALSRNEVELLRPACPIPQRRVRRHRESPLTILAVGHGSLVKGWDALEILWNLLEKRYDLRLIIAGSEGHSEVLYPEISRETAARANIPLILERLRADERVSVGPIPRELLLRQIYPEADVLVHLARMETFGFCILEAMSHELPVVATRLNAIPEMVMHGETGYLLDTTNASINSPSWAETVARAAVGPVESLITDADLRSRMGLAGRERVRWAFSVSYRERVLRNAYDEALAEMPSIPTMLLPEKRRANANES